MKGTLKTPLSLPPRLRKPAERLRRLLRTTRLSLELLLGRRLLMFAVVDFLVVGAALIAMLLGSGDEPQAVWSGVVLPPFLLLGLPALSGIVEVERRAGCLDLALTTPAAEGYFLRRVASVCGVLCVQGWLLMGFDWLYEGGAGFPLLSVLMQVPIISLFLGATALFWAVRLKSGGAVWLASMGTVLAFSRWFFANPIPDRHQGVFNAWLPGPEESLSWLGGALVLGAATLILFLYARRRLRRPETLVS
ncbi:MAG TPA: hypothetical protein VGS22_19685 [Thermoanaerobaculia bacterium]|jgi:hypothetical protein|nr:hypothetical protein [Thermoanaerobaculia bacterium]